VTIPIYTKSNFREGWIEYDRPFPDGFSEQAGPLIFREPGAEAGVGFLATKSHENYIGLVHGGSLMSLVDVTMWDICRRAVGEESLKAATITLNVEFMSPASVGDFIQGSGELLKGGRSILFARGQIRNDEKTLLSFSGTMKRVAR